MFQSHLSGVYGKESCPGDASVEQEVEGENEAEDDALGDENRDEEAPSDDGEVKGDQVGEDERGQRDLAHEESETSSFPGVEH